MSRTREYIETKNIGNLFEQLMRHVLSKRPDSPVQFLIKLLQEKGESIMTDPVPSVHTNGGLECSGHAIDIRRSLERILPHSASNPKPITILAGKITDKPAADTVVISRDLTRDTAVISRDLTRDTTTEDVIQVTQEVVTAVQSSRPKSGRKSSSSSSSSTDTLKSSEDAKKKKKVKKKKKKSSDSGDEKKSTKIGKSKKSAKISESETKAESETKLYEKEEKKVGDVALTNGHADQHSVATGTCDLTELGSWADGEMEAESVSCGSAVEEAVQHNTMSAVHSAPPPHQLYSNTPIKQYETEILQEEGFAYKTPDKGALMTSQIGYKTTVAVSKRVTSPCTTVFFEESDTEVPQIAEPELLVPVRSGRPVSPRIDTGLNGEGFPVIDTYRSEPGTLVNRDVSLYKLLHNTDNTSDKMSVSELSGLEWVVQSDEEQMLQDT